MKTLQPNSRFCFGCGMENPIGLKIMFYQTGPDEVTAECKLGEKYQGYPGVAHGGIVAAMLDEVAARSLMGGKPTRFMYTAKLNIKYRNNVPIGQPLRLVGKVVKVKKQTATAKGAVYGPDQDLLAEAEALLINVPDGVIDSADLVFLGWREYPEWEKSL